MLKEQLVQGEKLGLLERPQQLMEKMKDTVVQVSCTDLIYQAPACSTELLFADLSSAGMFY